MKELFTHPRPRMVHGIFADDVLDYEIAEPFIPRTHERLNRRVTALKDRAQKLAVIRPLHRQHGLTYRNKLA